MVRAGVVSHPAQWHAGRYHEIQCSRTRYRIVDRAALARLLEIDVEQLAAAHQKWIDTALRRRQQLRDGFWSEGVAVGSRDFVDRVVAELGDRAQHRCVAPIGGSFVVRETDTEYIGAGSLRPAPSTQRTQHTRDFALIAIERP